MLKEGGSTMISEHTPPSQNHRHPGGCFATAVSDHKFVRFFTHIRKKIPRGIKHTNNIIYGGKRNEFYGLSDRKWFTCYLCGLA